VAAREKGARFVFILVSALEGALLLGLLALPIPLRPGPEGGGGAHSTAKGLAAAALGSGARPDALRQGPALREALRRDFEGFVARTNQHLDGIGSQVARGEKGYALWATHEYFTDQSFELGDQAALVWQWVERNRTELVRAEITRVGLMSTRAVFGACSHVVE
jgi:hypothetical protein